MSPVPAPQLPDFRRHSADFRRLLSRQADDPTWYCQSFNPYPLAIAPEHFALQQRLQQVLYKALTKVVENYFHSEYLQDRLSLPLYVLKCLRKIADHPFQPGTYRPDFLHRQMAEKSSIAICEINARFPCNGYLISYYLNQILPQAQLLGLTSIAALDCVIDTFDAYFAGAEKISILAGREKGWDRHFLVYELKARGFKTQAAAIEAAINAPNIDAMVDQISRDLAEHSRLGILLELHQDELREDLLDLICSHFDRLICLNDPRTIFLLHDKRLLAVLSHKDELKHLLSESEADFLSQHISPTWVASQAPNIVPDVLTDHANYLLKPNLLGKGEGIIFGATTTAEDFQAALLDKTKSDYILQRLIEQE